MIVQRIPSTDRRLGRHVVHDERSRSFARTSVIDTTTWHTKSIRMYDPLPNPNQTIGNCTGCSKAMQFNAVGNRKIGRVLGMTNANSIYGLATTLDVWDGAWPPTDTGSSGLAAAKAAQKIGLGGTYRWLFQGADEVVQAVIDGDPVSVGTNWHEDMFTPNSAGRVTPTGPIAGGHQWTVRGYDVERDYVLGRCWWGTFRDFWISRVHLDDLLHADGDAHVQDAIL